MASDADWVAEVRRWVDSGAHALEQQRRETGGGVVDGAELGYEAAEPTLLARHWPDAPER